MTVLTYHHSLATLRISVTSTPMLKTLQTTNERTGIMSKILKLKDAGQSWRKLIETFRDEPQEGIVQDEDNQAVAVVLPMELYQLYQQERAKDFAVFQDVREDLKGYSDEQLQTRIDQAVDEVKAKALA